MTVFAGIELAINDQIRVIFTPPNGGEPMTFQCVVRDRNGYTYGVEFIPDENQCEQVSRMQRILDAMEGLRHAPVTQLLAGWCGIKLRCAASPMMAAPTIAQTVERLVSTRNTKLATAIAMGMGPVNAERASGTMALTSNPAAENMSAWIALRTMGLSARRPRYCSMGMIRNAGVITATSPATAAGNAADKITDADDEQAIRSRRRLSGRDRRVQLPVGEHVMGLDQIVLDHGNRGHAAEGSQRRLGQQQVEHQETHSGTRQMHPSRRRQPKHRDRRQVEFEREQNRAPGQHGQRAASACGQGRAESTARWPWP